MKTSNRAEADLRLYYIRVILCQSSHSNFPGLFQDISSDGLAGLTDCAFTLIYSSLEVCFNIFITLFHSVPSLCFILIL